MHRFQEARVQGIFYLFKPISYILSIDRDIIRNIKIKIVMKSIKANKRIEYIILFVCIEIL